MQQFVRQQGAGNEGSPLTFSYGNRTFRVVVVDPDVAGNRHILKHPSPVTNMDQATGWIGRQPNGHKGITLQGIPNGKKDLDFQRLGFREGGRPQTPPKIWATGPSPHGRATIDIPMEMAATNLNFDGATLKVVARFRIDILERLQTYEAVLDSILVEGKLPLCSPRMIRRGHVKPLRADFRSSVLRIEYPPQNALRKAIMIFRV